MHRRCLHATITRTRGARHSAHGVIPTTTRHASSDATTSKQWTPKAPGASAHSSAGDQGDQARPSFSSKPKHKGKPHKIDIIKRPWKVQPKVPRRPAEASKDGPPGKYARWEKRIDRAAANIPLTAQRLWRTTPEEPIPGEWLPTPFTGNDPEALKASLERFEARSRTDDLHMAMSDQGAEEEEVTLDNDTDQPSMSFSPGTLVETRKNERSITAIVLGERVLERSWRVLSLSASGEVINHSRADVHFAIPNYISADLAARCGYDFITANAQEISARVEALKRLKEAHKIIEASYKGTSQWQLQRAVNVYEQTRSADRTRWAKTTVNHVAHLIWQQPEMMNYFSAHKYLMENPLHFVAEPNYLKSQAFQVRPLREVEEIETVARWINEHRQDIEGPLSRFISKAKKVLVEEETTRQRRRDGPMTQLPATFTWNEEDQVVLSFLIRASFPVRSNQTDPYTLGRNTILKLVLPHGSAVTDGGCFDLLVKLGAVAPWQDMVELVPLANPTGDFDTKYPLVQEGEAIAKRTLESKAVAGAVLGPEDLRPSDPLDAVRHDFGDMKVFVIDSATAEELDDGVSVERIPSEPDNYWVHSHIADPASLLHPGHVLSIKARERGCTLYLGQKSLPLFPKSLIHHPVHGLSLGHRTKQGRGDLTLTFSSKLDSQGNILESKVRAGIVRNIRIVTYDQCDQALGLPPMEVGYPFGRAARPDLTTTPAPASSITEDDAADLKILYQLALNQCKKRKENDVFIWDNYSAKVDYLTTPPADVRSPYLRGAVWEGHPDVEYTVETSSGIDTGSRLLVSEMMKLASRAASRTALEHNVPLMRKCMEQPVFASEEDGAELLRARTWNGYIPMYKYLNHVAINPSSQYSLEAKGHAALGVPEGEGYSRATSPLRRFEDLVAHWQMHSILLGTKPYLDVVDMEKMANESMTTEKRMKELSLVEKKSSLLLFMRRWMRGDVKRTVEDPLLRPLEAYKISTVKLNFKDNTYICMVLIPELGLQAHLSGLPASFADVPLTTQLKVKVHSIEVGISRPTLLVKLVE